MYHSTAVIIVLYAVDKLLINIKVSVTLKALVERTDGSTYTLVFLWLRRPGFVEEVL